MASEHVHELSDSNFASVVNEGISVIDFWAPWCGPCRMMGPVFEDAAKTLKHKAVFAKVNVDDNPQLASRFGVMAIPTLVFLKDGQLVDKMTGVQSADTIGKCLETL